MKPETLPGAETKGKPRSRRLLFFCMGTIFATVGGVILKMPWMNYSGVPSLVWFLAAALAFTVFTYSLSNRYRLTVMIAMLCAIGALVWLRSHSAMVPAETEVGFKTRMDYPQFEIGSPAPEIDARDLSGEPMKLSDYRGKVVLLVFWYSTCGPCMGDVPHEKTLVERFAGRPFALVGVNGDSAAGKALAAIKSHSIPWKSFWNGGGDGPITRDWGIWAWPTVYLVDDLGVIQHYNLRGDALDEPLERMIAVAEARGRKK